MRILLYAMEKLSTRGHHGYDGHGVTALFHSKNVPLCFLYCDGSVADSFQCSILKGFSKAVEKSLIARDLRLTTPNSFNNRPIMTSVS